MRKQVLWKRCIAAAMAAVVVFSSIPVSASEQDVILEEELLENLISGQGMSSELETLIEEISAETAGSAELEWEQEDTAIDSASEVFDSEVSVEEITTFASEDVMVCAAAEISGDYTYTELNGTYAEITAYNGAGGDVVIPEMLDGFTVQSVGSKAFAGHTEITSVTLPDTVTKIGANAFSNCTQLTSVTVKGAETIAENAFLGCTALTDVSLPETLETIYAYVFSGCTALKTIVLPDSLQKIGYRTFQGCTALSEVNVPKSWTQCPGGLGAWNSERGEVFYGCTSLHSIEIPTGIEAVPDYAFRNCTSLTLVELPTTLQKTGAYAFAGCSGLSSIELPEMLSTIDAYAFADCTGLTEITIPEQVTQISEYAYKGCVGLTEVTIPSAVETIGTGAFSECTGLTSVNLKEGLNTLYAYAFSGCTGLTELSLPDSLTTIGYKAFLNCSGLTSVNFPLQFTETPGGLGSWNSEKGELFVGCKSLKTVTIPEGVKKLPSYTFMNAVNLKQIVLPSTIEAVGAYAFSGCSGLRTVSLNEGLTKIEESAFSGCTGLRRLTVPTSVVTIYNAAFENCTGLSEVSLQDGLQTIYGYAFSGCSSLTELVLPNTLTTIGYRAFAQCTDLTSVRLSSNFASAPGNLGSWSSEKGQIFFGCTALHTLTIPEGMTVIPDYTFQGMGGISDLLLPSSITSIGAYALADCSTLERIWIGDTVEKIGQNAFQNCSKLVIHGVSGSYAETYAAENNFTFAAEMLTLAGDSVSGAVKDTEGAAVAGVRVYIYDVLRKKVLGSTVTGEDGSWSFEGVEAGSWYQIEFKHAQYRIDTVISCTAESGMLALGEVSAKRLAESGSEEETTAFTYSILNGSYISITGYTGTNTNVVVPETIDEYTVQVIAESAFAGNTAIRQVILPETIKKVGKKAFENCSALETVSIGGAETICEYAFAGCTSLTYISLPSALKTIYAYVFQNCTSLEKIVLPNNVSVIGYKAFDGCKKLASVNYPIGWTSSPGNLGAWSSEMGYIFHGCSSLTSITVPEGVTELAPYAFSGAANLDTVALPATLKKTGAYAFASCTSLKTLVLPEGLETLSEHSFDGCTALSELILPEGISKIEGFAFSGCKALGKISIPASVKVIGANAFENCTGLASVQLKEGLNTLYAYVFSGCTGLTELTLPNSLTTIGYRAFQKCTGLVSVTLPTGFVSAPGNLGSWSSEKGGIFYGCTKLTDITVPEGAETIPAYAFQNCTALNQVTFPESLKKIEAYAFSGCTGLKKVAMCEGIEVIQEYAFSGCSGIRTLTIPASVTQIKWNAFANCTGLSDLTLQEGLTTINNCAFYGCTALKTAVLPDSITTMGYRVFGNCTGLTTMNYPAAWTAISTEGGWSSEKGEVFYNCKNLAKIKLPEGIEVIPAYALRSTTGFIRIDLPESVTAIGDYALADCTGLKQIWIGEAVEKIGTNAFQNCAALTIHGVEGSYAETFAKEKGFSFSTDKLEKEEEILTGTVIEESGTPVAGVAVTIYDTENKRVVGTTETDEEGRWTFSSAVEEKTYQIHYAHSRYSFEKNTVSCVAVKGTLTLDPVTAKLLMEAKEPEDGALFTYSVLNGSEIAVTGYTGDSTYVVVPEQIGEYTVTKIADKAFVNRTTLEQLVLPDTVKVIGASAFSGCKALKTAGIGNGIETIQTSAFSGCTSLTDISLPGTLKTMYAYAFSNCKGLEKLTLPDALTTTGYRAFENCISLETVNFPIGWTECPGNLGSWTTERGEIFYGCTGIQEITLPEGMTAVPDYAFKNVQALETVSFPSTLTKTGEHSFESCTALKEIKFSDKVTKTGAYVFSGCTALTAITLPEGLTEIGEGSFAGCTALAEVKLPSTVTKLGTKAYQNCDALTSVELPEKVETIYAYAFGDCDQLEAVMLPDSVVTMGYRVFENCKKLTDVTLSGGLTSCPGGLGAWSSNYGELFAGCTSLTSLVIPEGMTVIAAYAFKNSPALEQVQFPSTLTETGSHVFENCTALKEIQLSEKVTRIGAYAFSGCTALTDITCPEGLTEVEEGSFAGCSSLEAIHLPSTVVKLGAKAYQNCDALTSVELPEKVETICAYAFSNCDLLDSIELPDSITTMGYRVFENCKSLQSVNYPAALTSCPGGLGAWSSNYGELFYGCSSLKNLVIPEGVETIPAYIFQNCTSLRNVTLPSTVKTIGKMAFSGCIGIPVISLNTGLTSIGESAFYNCQGLNRLTIPGSLTTISSSAFENCISLAAVRLEPGVAGIGNYAFKNNTLLKEIYIPSTVTEFGKDIFTGCDDLTIYCVQGSQASLYAIKQGIAIKFYEDGVQEAESLFDQEATGYELFVSDAQAKGYLTGKVYYKLADTKTEAESLQICFPVNTELIAKTVKLNDVLVSDYTYKEGILSIPCTEAEATVTFSLKPQSGFSYDSYAALNYTEAGKSGIAVIGTVTEEIPLLTIEVPEDISSSTVEISGAAGPEELVDISLNGTLVKSVYARKSGKYHAVLQLDNPKNGDYYTVTASVTEASGKTYSASTEMWYIEDMPSLTRFDMYYNNHASAKLNLLMNGINGMPVSFNPAYPFKFVVSFDHTDKVKNVTIQSNKNGIIRTMDAVYDGATNTYVASGYFGGQRNYVPGTLSVVYNREVNTSAATAESLLALNTSVYREEIAHSSTTVKEVSDGNTTTYYYKTTIDEESTADSGTARLGKTELEYSVKIYDKLNGTEFSDLFDVYDFYDMYLNIKSDKYVMNVIDAAVEDPVSGMSGVMILIGDTMDNKVVQYFFQGVEAGNLSATGKAIKALGKVYGTGVDAAKLRAAVNTGDYSPQQKEMLLAEIDLYEKTCGVYNLLAGAAAVGFALNPPATAGVYVAYYITIYVCDKFFEEWKGMLEDGNVMFGWIVDPSGYVYATVTNNRLEGVKVTVYYKDESGNAVQWDAEQYLQQNPLYTDSDGFYAWDVPEGQWQVKYELDGYQTAYSEWYDVPPAQTEVHMNMISTETVQVEAIHVYPEYAELTFTQYVEEASLNKLALTSANGTVIPTMLQYEESGTDENGTTFVKRCRLIPQEGSTIKGGASYQVSLPLLQAGNGTQIAAQTITAVCIQKQNIVIASAFEMASGAETEITGTIDNYTGTEQIICTPSDITAEITSIEQPDQDGRFTIHVKGNMIGSTELELSVVGTSVTAVTSLTVKPADSKVHTHVWDDGTVTKEADCVTQGEVLYQCLSCSQTKTEVIAATGVHSWDNGKITKTATCVEEGEKTYTCTCKGCTATKTEKIPVTKEHVYEKTGKVTKEATCVEEGEKTYTCTRKGCTATKTEKIPKLDGTVTPAAGTLKLQVKKSVMASKLVSGLMEGDYITNVTSSNPKVVTVTPSGSDWKIRGKAVSTKKTGTSDVTITLASGASATITFKVQKAAVKASSVTVTNVTKKKLSLELGDTYMLAADVKPITTSDQLKFKTSDKKVVTVNSKGMLTAKKAGKAEITILAGKKSLKINVTVKKKAATDFKLNKTRLTLKLKKTALLKPVFTPKNSEAKVTYKTSDRKIATVSKSGKVKGIKKGSAVITASITLASGVKITRSCTVIVR